LCPIMKSRARPPLTIIPGPDWDSQEKSSVGEVPIIGVFRGW
jgi:hypothetical protein